MDSPNWVRAFSGQVLLTVANKASKKAWEMPTSSPKKLPSSLPSGIPDPDPDPQPLKGLIPPESARAEEEELEDLTAAAEKDTEAEATTAGPTRRPVRPPHPTELRQEALPLMPGPDPEHCAAVLQKASGGLFIHGPLVPTAVESELGGRLHPCIRNEWMRVLEAYFKPLNMTRAQIDADLGQLGRFIKARGLKIVLPTLVNFKGERFVLFMMRALAWDGRALVQAVPSAPRPSRQADDELAGRRPPPRRSEPEPIRMADHLRELRIPAPLTSAQREFAERMGVADMLRQEAL
jgi:hypothetical protein